MAVRKSSSSNGMCERVTLVGIVQTNTGKVQLLSSATCRARAESAYLAKHFTQKGPSTVTEQDLVSYNIRDEFLILKNNAPLLMHAVAGSMNLRNADLEVKVGGI